MRADCAKCGGLRDGSHQSYCRACERIRGRQWYRDHRDQGRAASARNWKKNKERLSAQHKEWRLRNLDARAAYLRAWRLKSGDEHRAWRRRYYALKRSKILSIGRAWRAKNKAYVNARQRAYLAANRDRQKIYAVNAKAFRRKAMGAHRITRQAWALVQEKHKHRCFYCGAKGLKLTVDHFIPLKLGGENKISNVVPACMTCNCSKSALPPEEFALRRGRLCW